MIRLRAAGGSTGVAASNIFPQAAREIHIPAALFLRVNKNSGYLWVRGEIAVKRLHRKKENRFQNNT